MQQQRAIFLAAGMFMAAALNAQSIPLDTAVHTGTLPNGFTYYIRHNEQPKNRVFLYLVNKVGSVLEDDDQRGLAHFMEHMNFNGTTHFPKNELVNYLQKSGVRFGADLNAYTGFDETVYQLPLPADDPSILQNGFQIMRDWAQNATLDTTEINKERGVILEEERLGRGANERMQREFMPLLLNHSRYADRIPIGKVDILNSFRPAAIKRFHADWYRPDLQALVVVGDINVAETEILIRNLFSDLKNPANEKFRTKYRVALTGENQFAVITDKEMPVVDLQILIKHQDDSLVTAGDYINSMKQQLYNQIMGERIGALSQTANVPFLGAEVKIDALLGGLDAFTVNIVLKQGKYQEGFQAVWELIEKARQFGFTETELERARQNYLNGMETGYRERNKTASESYVNEYKRLFLEHEASPGIAWEYQFVKDHISKISLESLNALSREYIREKDRDILILAPEKNRNDLPDSARISSWMRAVDQQKLTAFSDDVSGQVLLAAIPDPGKVIFRKKIPQGVTELKLSNGVRVILKPTDFKNDEIQFQAYSSGGTSLYPDALYENASASGVIGSFGVGNFNPVQLGKVLNGKIVSISPFIGEREEGVSGSATPKDLETALQLVYLYFTQPRKDTTLFQNTIANAREMLQSRYSDPNNVFSDTVNFILGNYNPRRSPATVAKLDELSLEKMYRIYKERFSDASGFTFVFVGNFTVDSIRPMLERYLGSLPTMKKNEKARDLNIHIPAGKISRQVFKGSENKATVKMVFSGTYIFGSENNLLLNAIKEVLAIKIVQHLREEESEVYSPRVAVNYNKYPAARYAFSVNFGCAPANADHLMNAVMKEIDALKKSGPSAEDIEKFKAEYRRVQELNLTQNSFWLTYLTNQYQNQETVAQSMGDAQALNKITTAAVQKAANLYLKGDNVIRLELLPETTVK